MIITKFLISPQFLHQPDAYGIGLFSLPILITILLNQPDHLYAFYAAEASIY
jgi:hypothetical protein